MKEFKITLRNAGKIAPDSIDDYIREGGYQALKKARDMDREKLIDEIEGTGKLHGRGGAGFKETLNKSPRTSWREIQRRSALQKLEIRQDSCAFAP